MTSLTTTWCPNSFQLRLAFNDRKTPPVVFARTRLHKLDRRFRLFGVAENGPVNDNRVERRRSGNYWAVNSNSSADGYAGWKADEQSGDSPPKQSLKGIMGAGIAGVVLVAGLTIAALAIGKRSPSNPGLKRKPKEQAKVLEEA